MHGPYIRLFSASLLLIVFAFIWGCSQPDDVVAPISTTKICMSPACLPSTPDGYSYELWVMDTLDNHYSIGKFLWDNYMYRFYDLDSNRLDTVWTVQYDLLNPFYRYLAVSVEELPDIYPDSAGPIMLRDTIVNPEIWPMLLAFPVDYSYARVTFGMETPTDKDSDSHDASGVWFAFYDYHRDSIVDTTNVVSSAARAPRPQRYDTTYWRCDAGDAFNCTRWVEVTTSSTADTLIVDSSAKPVDTLYWICEGRDEYGDCINWIDISDLFHWYDTLINPISYDTVVYDTLMDTLAISCVIVDTNYQYVPHPLLIDTFTHISVSYDYVVFPVNFDTFTIDTFAIDLCTGETIPDQIKYLSDNDITPPTNLTFTTNVRAVVNLDRFIASHEEITDLSGTKWHYKGWVISPYLAPPYQTIDCDELGRLTKPAWLPFTMDYYFDEPDKWPIISTGSFKSFDKADYTPNIYSDNKRVPNFPGEDFIRNLPCGADNYYFADKNSPIAMIGDIFVTLEPDNFDENTNFPILLFITRHNIPAYGSVSATTPDISNLEQQRGENFDMLNIAGRVEGNPFGFPGIKVHLIRE
jgi:hypothetical protein